MSGVTCSHPHNLPYNDECNVWWLRGTPDWRRAHTNLAADDPPEYDPEDAQAHLAADTQADANAEMHWVDTGEVG